VAGDSTVKQGPVPPGIDPGGAGRGHAGRRGLALAGAALLLVLSCVHFARSAYESQAHGFVDFPIFLAQARQFLLTGELYIDPDEPGAYSPAAAVYKFPPLYAMLLLPVARAGIEQRVYLAHWVLQFLLYACAVGLLLAYLHRFAGRGFLLAGLVLALNFEPFFETLWRLQIETVLLLLLAVALLAYLKERDTWAGAAIGTGFLLKLYPGFLLLYFALRRRWSALAGFALAVVLILIASWIVIGPRENETYFLRILPVLLTERPEASTENLSLARYLHVLLGWSPLVSQRAGQIVVLPLVLLSGFVVWRQPPSATSGRLRAALAFSLFVPLMLMSMPNYWVNYQLLLLLPLLVLACHASRAGPDAAPTAWLAGLAYIPLLFYWPCADPSVPWPCASTPLFLGLVRLPRSFHDLMVALRGVSTFLLWAAILSALMYGAADPRRSAARHLPQSETLDEPG